MTERLLEGDKMSINAYYGNNLVNYSPQECFLRFILLLVTLWWPCYMKITLPERIPFMICKMRRPWLSVNNLILHSYGFNGVYNFKRILSSQRHAELPSQ